MQRIEPRLPLRCPLPDELVRHHLGELACSDVERQAVRRGEQVPLRARRPGREPEPGEQRGILRGGEERIARDAELLLRDLRHLGESQPFAHGEALLDPAAALQRRHHVRPRLVPSQQIHTALEGTAQAAQLRVQPERGGMAYHPARGE